MVSCVIFLVLLSFSYGSNILFIIPTQSISHQIFYRPLIYQLLAKGHKVTYITTHPFNDTSLVNLSEVDISSSHKHTFQTKSSLLQVSEGVQMQFIRDIVPHTIAYGDLVLKNEKVREYIVNKHKYKFDLVVYEALEYLLAGFGNIYNCPIVGVISLANMPYIDFLTRNVRPLMGGTANEVPYTHPMSLYERWMNFWVVTFGEYEHDLRRWYYGAEVYRHHFGGNKTLNEVLDRNNIFLINQHPILVQPKPNLPGIIGIGGMNNLPVQNLPEVRIQCVVQ